MKSGRWGPPTLGTAHASFPAGGSGYSKPWLMFHSQSFHHETFGFRRGTTKILSAHSSLLRPVFGPPDRDVTPEEPAGMLFDFYMPDDRNGACQKEWIALFPGRHKDHIWSRLRLQEADSAHNKSR